MKITIDQDVCIGNGNCVIAAPDVFDQRESDGVVTLLTDEPSEELFSAVLEAEASCPSKAIKVER
jgi:ferredoxin